MFKGRVVAIHICANRKENMQAHDQIEAIAGKGLVGDRFFKDNQQKPKRQVTLIEQEAIEAVQNDYNIPLQLHETRRNILTKGVPLNHLIGKEFQVGEVKMRGAELCEPCSHLQKMTHPGVMKALIHRGGIRAEILNDGQINVGDQIFFSEEIT